MKPDAPRLVILRRPGVIFCVYLFRLLGALLIAGPIALAVGPDVSGFPRGDAVLFDPGGLVLLDTLRLARVALSSAVLQGLVAILFLAFAGLLPLAALIAAVGRPGPVTFSWLAERGARHLGTFSLLFGLTLLAQAIASGVIVVSGAVLAAKLNLTDPAADAIRASAGALAVLVALGIGVLQDLARVAAVDGDVRLYEASARAWRAFKKAKVRTIAAYAARTLATAIVIGGALMLGRFIGIERAGQIALGWIVHQAAIFVAVALRASWLATAIGIVRVVVPVAEPAAVPEQIAADPPGPKADEGSGGVESTEDPLLVGAILPVELDAEPPAGNVAPPDTL